MSSFIDTFGPQLNPAQLEAVKNLDGPLLVLAGAGSGKTRVLTFRVAHLIAAQKAAPSEILAVTFTNKAAREMEHRIISLLSKLGFSVVEPMWINTFHSFCARLLRNYIHLLDYKSHFTIYDSNDQISMIKKVLNALDVDEKLYPAKSFQARINRAKTLGLNPAQVKKDPSFLMDHRSLEVYEFYEREMKAANALDFGDLLMKTLELFNDYPAVLDQLQKQFKYILVDEYQDTNRIQYLIIKALAREHKNLCVVGDEDQSIYSWRGADISNILDFEKDFPKAKTVKLEQNYRSTKTIVSAATALIRNNTLRKDKTLFTENQTGEPIHVREERNEYEEARFVVRTIESLMAQSQLSYSDFAVFYRTNAQSRVIEDQCRSHGIAYRIVGGLKFYERLEIKDILGYMKLILNPGDDIAFKRVINVPARGLGKATLTKLDDLANQNGLRLFEAAAKAVQEKVVHGGAVKKTSDFLDLLVSLRQKAERMNVADLYREILYETGYLVRLKEENTPEAQARIENLEEFNNAIVQFCEERGEDATLQNFLEEMALVSDVDKMTDQDNAITLMTLHISKGLEYPVVFMVGMEEGLFPSAKSEDSLDPNALEEERRVCYVGMTRARERLFMSYARSRTVWGNQQFHSPSRFLDEIPDDSIEFQSAIQTPRFLDRARQEGRMPSSYANVPTNSQYDEMPSYEDFSDLIEGQSEFRKGQKVRHPTYGVGSICQVEGSGENLKVSVMFPGKHIKKFVAKYARLERV